MTEQCDIFIALFHKTANLFDDLSLLATALASANVRNDAIRAEIVTTIHNGNPRTVTAFATDGKILNHRVFCLLRAIDALAGFALLAKQLRQSVQGRGAHYKIDVRIAELDIVLTVLLRHHTATNSDHERGILLLDVLVLPNNGERSLFGMLANGTGVDHDKICLIGFINNVVAHFLAHTRKLFAIRHVLLTAKGFDIRPRARTRCLKNAIVFGTHTVYI